MKTNEIVEIITELALVVDESKRKNIINQLPVNLKNAFLNNDIEFLKNKIFTNGTYCLFSENAVVRA